MKTYIPGITLVANQNVLRVFAEDETGCKPALPLPEQLTAAAKELPYV